MILPDTSIKSALQTADKLRQSISSKNLVKRNTGDDVGRITMSFGIAQYSMGEDIESFIPRADDALYKAKANGRDQVRANTAEMALSA